MRMKDKAKIPEDFNEENLTKYKDMKKELEEYKLKKMQEKLLGVQKGTDWEKLKLIQGVLNNCQEAGYAKSYTM